MTKSYKELIGKINESDKHFKTKNNNQSEIWNRLSVHGRRAEVALSKLQKGIAALKKMDDSKNYGHVGSLEKVANDLEDLVAFLGPIKEDVDIEGKESTMTESEDLVKNLLAGKHVTISNKKAGQKFNTALRKAGFKYTELSSESDTGSVQVWTHGNKKYEVAIDHVSDETGHFSLYAHPLKESEDLNEGSNSMRTWVIHQLEQTERPHDEILADFKKKFGADKVKDFDKIVSEIVD